MASPIIFRIQDGVDPQIAQNVAAIGDAARKADASVQVLTQGLQAIQASGIQGLARQLSNTSTATTRLSNTTAKMASAALTAAQNIDKLVTSYGKLDAAIAASIAALNTYQTTLQSTTGKTTAFTAASSSASSGTKGMTGNFIASSAALQALEGKFTGNARSAGRFLTTTLGLGPALQAAFPVFGAIALLGVIGVVTDAVNKLLTRMHNITAEAQNDAIALLNSQQLLIKGEKGALTKVFNLTQNRPNLKDIQIDNPSIIIRELNFQLQINDLIAQRNQFGKQGLELQKAKVQSVLDEIKATKNAIDTIQTERSKIQNSQGTGLLDAKITVDTGTRIRPGPKGVGIPSGVPTIQPLIPVDSSQWKQLISVAKEYDNELDRLNKQLLILQDFKLDQAKAKEPFAAAKDEAKAARLQLKQFADELAKLKGKDQLVTPQEKLDLLLKQREKASLTHPSNVPVLDIQIGTQTQAIERQQQALHLVNERLKDQVDNIGLYSDALKEANEFDKISLELKKNGVVLTTQQTNGLKDLIHQSISQQTFQRELKRVYDESNAPLREYQAKLQAINKLESDGAITHSQALIAQNEANKIYKDAILPLNEYAHGLQNEIDLLGKYGIKATVAAELQKVQNDLRNKGRSLSQQELLQLDQFLTKLENEKQLQQAVNKLYEENAGAIQKLTIAVLALNQARQRGIISERQYDTQLVKLRVDLANLNIEMGKFTKADVVTATFGSFLKDFKGLTTGIVQTWQQAFNTIADGAANALGRAIAYGENLGDALKDVARQALSELISGFIKLGIQMLVSTIIGKTAGQTAVGITVAQAAAAGAAWAAPAALASLATLGANAAPADIALTSTVGLAELLGALHFNTGGIVPGLGSKDTVPALLTPGESVLNQMATRFIGASTIQAWNKGNFAQPTAGTGSGAAGRQALVLNLIHDKNAVDVVQLNESTIRVMARQEAQKAVATDAPAVVARHIANPNSDVRKSLAVHTDVRGKH